MLQIMLGLLVIPKSRRVADVGVILVDLINYDLS